MILIPIKFIVLTGNSESELVKLSDEAIYILTEETIFRTESLTSRISYQTIMDILYMNLMFHDVSGNTDSMDRIRQNIGTAKENAKNFIG